MDWLAKRVKLKNFSPNSARPCALCTCNRTDTPFKEFGETARWMGTILCPPQPRASDFPGFSIPGVTIFTVRVDSMHVLDLGIIAHLVGNMLFHLVFDAGLPGGRTQLRVLHLWGRIRHFYTVRNTANRISKLEVQMFCKHDAPRTSFPCSRLKAAENRDLVPVLQDILRELGLRSRLERVLVETAGHYIKFREVCVTAQTKKHPQTTMHTL